MFTDVKVVDGVFKDMTNYLTIATNIHGPWTTPIRLNGVGFDPSLFHDEDGRKYLVQQTWIIESIKTFQWHYTDRI